MDKHLEIETELRKKIKEIGKKSAARKTALKQLEKAYKIAIQEIEILKYENEQLKQQNLPWWKR